MNLTDPINAADAAKILTLINVRLMQVLEQTMIINQPFKV